MRRSSQLVAALLAVANPSMLDSTNPEGQRRAVRAREQADNATLARVCAEFAANCRGDGGAVYACTVAKGDVSTVDYFHRLGEEPVGVSVSRPAPGRTRRPARTG